MKKREDVGWGLPQSLKVYNSTWRDLSPALKRVKGGMLSKLKVCWIETVTAPITIQSATFSPTHHHQRSSDSIWIPSPHFRSMREGEWLQVPTSRCRIKRIYANAVEVFSQTSDGTGAGCIPSLGDSFHHSLWIIELQKSSLKQSQLNYERHYHSDSSTRQLNF